MPSAYRANNSCRVCCCGANNRCGVCCCGLSLTCHHFTICIALTLIRVLRHNRFLYPIFGLQLARFSVQRPHISTHFLRGTFHVLSMVGVFTSFPFLICFDIFWFSFYIKTNNMDNERNHYIFWICFAFQIFWFGLVACQVPSPQP